MIYLAISMWYYSLYSTLPSPLKAIFLTQQTNQVKVHTIFNSIALNYWYRVTRVSAWKFVNFFSKHFDSFPSHHQSKQHHLHIFYVMTINEEHWQMCKEVYEYKARMRIFRLTWFYIQEPTCWISAHLVNEFIIYSI